MFRTASPTALAADVLPQLTDPQLAAAAKLAFVAEQPGAVAVLCGPAGVGKTTVLGHVIAMGLPGDPVIRGGTLAGLSDLDAHGGDHGAGLPDVLLVDDAHRAAAAELVEFVDRWRRRHAAVVIVLAGEGRLLSLAARDPRLEQSVRLRVAIPPFSLAESVRVLADRLPAATVGAGHEAVVRTIHEIAGGVPKLVLRLADIAAVLAQADPSRGVVPDDIETIHRRLCLQAA